MKNWTESNRLRAQMVLVGLTSRDIAKQCGVSESYVSRVIHGSSTGKAADTLRQRIEKLIAASVVLRQNSVN